MGLWILRELGFRGSGGGASRPPQTTRGRCRPRGSAPWRHCASAETRNLGARLPGPSGPCSLPYGSPATRLQLLGGWPAGGRSWGRAPAARLILSPSGPVQLGLGAMYAVYKQAHPPTGLEFSMYCNFFNNSERNLVVAGTSQLYVYRLNRDAEVGRPAPAAAPRGRVARYRRRGRPDGPRGWLCPEPVLFAATFLHLFPRLAGSEACPARLICSFVFLANYVNTCCVLGGSDAVVNKTWKNLGQEDTR